MIKDRLNSINIYKLLLYVIMIDCFVSLTANIYPSFMMLGKTAGLLLIGCLALLYISTFNKRDYFLLSFLFVIFLLFVFRIDDFGVDLEHFVYLVSTTSILWKFSEYKTRKRLLKEVLNSKKEIIFFCGVATGVIALSTLFKSSWPVINGQHVFKGFCQSGHKLAGNLCLMSGLYLACLYDRKATAKNLIPFAVVLLVMLLTGSRTYLLSYIVILLALYFVKLTNIKNTIKNVKHIRIIIPVVLVILAVIFFKSSVFQRFVIMAQNKHVSSNFFEAISSGRLIWWKIDINDYLHMPFINKLFGKGYTYLYNLNDVKYGLRISAHNDFINLLVGCGLFGVLGYLLIIIRWFAKIDKSDRKGRIISVTLSSVLFLFNSLVSGAYGAQQYILCNLFVSLFLLDLVVERNESGGDGQ